MRDGDEVLDQFLFRRDVLCVQDYKLAVVGRAEMNEKSIGKTCQAILVGQDHPLDFPRKNLIHQAQKVFALEIHPAAYFHDPLIHVNVLLMTILLKNAFLIR